MMALPKLLHFIVGNVHRDSPIYLRTTETPHRVSALATWPEVLFFEWSSHPLTMTLRPPEKITSTKSAHPGSSWVQLVTFRPERVLRVLPEYRLFMSLLIGNFLLSWSRDTFQNT